MSSIRQNSLITTSAVLIVTLSIFGWIYSKFPAGWYEPTDLGAMASTAVIHYMMTGMFMLTFPPVGIVAFAALTVAYIWRPQKINHRHLSLLIPLVAVLPLCLWSGYWFQHDANSDSSIAWMLEVNQDLIRLTLASLVLSILFVVFSKSWKRERFFGLSLLTSEGVYLMFLLFSLGMRMDVQMNLL
ncbi:MAG: hypothetical protein H6677_24685 [Candidatus Obscuribacterales bacterium]|nr:hypothetical protein [Candidatus Obscuribacterales bacterium]